MKKEIKQLLHKDYIRNANFIYFDKAYTMYDFIVVGNSVAATGKSDREWVYISSESANELKIILGQLDSRLKCYAIIEDWMIPYIQGHKNMVWQLSCEKLVFPEDKVLPEINQTIKELKPEASEYIFNNYGYQSLTNIDYIKERLTIGEGLGIYEDDLLVAWVITHDDGAIGFLQVLDDYRKKGYGKALTIAMIRKLRNENKLPYVHIESDNHPSISLAKNMGFEYDRNIHWFELE